MKRFGTLFLLLIFSIAVSYGQVTYYSQSGETNPTNTSSWNTIPGGGGSTPSNFSSAGDIFIVQSGHTMTLPGGSWTISGSNSELRIDGNFTLGNSTSVTVERCQIFIGDNLTVNDGAIFTVNNGNAGGYDLIVQGNLINYGSIVYGGGATAEVQTTGSYYHRVDGGTVPLFTWNGNAKIVIDNIVSATSLSGLNQAFREFRWNNASQTSNVQFNSQLTTVNKLLWVNSTGSGSIVLFNSSANLNATYFDLTGGTVDFTTVGTIFPSVTINSSGTAFGQLSGTTIKTSGAGSKGLFKIGQDVNNISQEGTIGPGAVGFHLLPGAFVDPSNSDIDVTGDFIIDSAATFGFNNTSNFKIVGSGNFDLRKHANFYNWDDAGFTPSPTASGAVQVTGTRSFNNLANYYFWGGTQVTGNSTPDTINGNVELWAGTSVTLSKNTIINGKLTIIDAPFNVGNFTLDLRGDIIDSLNLSVLGSFQSNPTGTIIYNKGSHGQKVITNNSQYGNLTFNNYQKNLHEDTLLVSNVFSPGSAVHNVDALNTIEFNGANAQTVPPFNYGNLSITSFRNSSNVTFSSADTIFIASGFYPQATFGGGSYVTTNSTLEFNGNNGQTIPALSGSVPYYSVSVRKSSGALNVQDSDIELNGNLSLFDGIFDDNGYIVTVKGNILGSNGEHISSIEGGKILLTGGSSTHTISDVDLGVVELDDATNGATITAAPGVKEMLLVSGTLDITNGLYILNGGALYKTGGDLSASGFIVFNGEGTVVNSFTLNDVILNGSVSFASGSTIEGVLQINNGGSVYGNALTYQNGSILKYNSGGTYSRGLEWSATSGPGYPSNVEIFNSTTLNLGANGGYSAEHKIQGWLTIDAGSTLSMNEDGEELSAPLTVNGDFTNEGTMMLSSVPGGFLNLKGNLYQNGTLTSNSSSVRFSGSGNQTISKSGGGYAHFDSLVVMKSDTLIVLYSPFTHLRINNVLDIQSGVLKMEGGSIDFANNTSFINSGGTFFPENHIVNFEGVGSTSGTLGLWNVNIFGDVSFSSNTSIISELKIHSGGSISTNPPEFGYSSTLIYSSGGTFSRNMEWSSTSGPGYPHHVQITNNTTVNLGANGGTGTIKQIAGNLIIDDGSVLLMNEFGYEMTQPLIVLENISIYGWLIGSGSTGNSIHIGGDLYRGSNSAFYANGGAVHFIGNGDQKITSESSGSITFYGLVINKPSGNLILDDVIGTNIVLDSTLTLISGNLDLKDRSMQLQYSNVEIVVDGGERTITGLPGSSVYISGDDRTVTSVSGGSLVFDTSVAVQINAVGMDFGGNISTIKGRLELVNQNAIAVGGAPVYDIGSTLAYSVDGTYNRGDEWSATSGAGYPHNVEIIGSTNFNLGYGDSSVSRQIAGNLFIESGSLLTMDASSDKMIAPLTVIGDVLIEGELRLSSESGGNFEIGGDWTLNDTFTPNGRSVTFNGSAQSLNGATTFDDLKIDNNTMVTLNDSVLVNGALTLLYGKIDTQTDTLTIGPSGSVDTYSNSYVIGNLRKTIPTGSPTITFEIGDGSNYAPINILVSTVTESGTMTASTSTTGPELTGSFIDSNKNVNRFWTITNNGTDFWQSVATFNFDNAEVDGGATTTNFDARRWDGVQWNDETPTGWSASMVDVNFLTQFGTFALGEIVKHDITSTAGSGGYITPDGVTGVTHGNTQGYTITPNAGYSIDSVNVDGSNQGAIASYDFTNVTEPHTIDAFFQINSYVISTANYGNGSVSPSSPSVNYGGDQLVSINPDVDHHIDSVYIDGVNHGVISSYNFTSVSATHTVDAYFSQNVQLLGEYEADDKTRLLMHFNEESGSTVNEYSFLVNLGTAYGTTIVPGRFGNARSFDGEDDDIVSQPNVIPTFGNYTVDFWMYADSAANAREIYGQGRTGNNTYLGYDQGLFRTQGWGLIDSIRVPFNAWHHIALVKTETNTYFYIDGVLRAERGSPAHNPTQPDSFIIGNQFDRIGENWKGMIDEMRVSSIIRAPETFNLQLPPTLATANASGTSIFLDWINGGGAAPFMRYRIYRGLDSISMSLVDSTTLTNITNPGLVGPNIYYYRIAAVDSTGFESAKSFAMSDTVFDYVAPAAPQNLMATAGDGQATIHWNPNIEADFYKYFIYRGTSPNPTTVVDSTADINDTLKVYSGLSNYQVYYFRITAKDVNGNTGTYSNEVSVMPTDQTPPSVPASLVAIANDEYIDLTWSANSESDFAKYYVYGGITPNPSVKIDSIFIIGNSFRTITNLTNYTAYYYRVTAVDTSGNESGYSNEESVFPVDLNPPSTPENISVVTSDGSIELKWNSVPETDFHKYYIYRDVSPTPTTIVDSIDNASDTLRTYSGLTNGTLYHLKVVATDTNGNVSVSDIRSAVPVVEAGNALQFNGIDGYVQTPINSLSGDFTLEVWVKPNTPTDYRPIISKNTSNGSGNEYAEFNLQVQNNGNLNFFMSNGSTYALDLNGGILIPGQWYHVAVTVSGLTGKMYLNGEETSNNSFSGSRIYNNLPVEIGKYNNGSIQFFDGELDEVRIWNVARTEAQIKNSMVKNLRGDTPNLVTLYHMDEPNGTTNAYDASPYNNSGSLEDGVSFVAGTGAMDPFAPSTLIGSASDGQAHIQWISNNESDFNKYYIYRGTSPNPTTIVDSTSNIIDTLKTYSGLSNYSNYFFRIRASDLNGNLSPYSNEVSVMPMDQTALNAPQNISAIAGDGQATIHWNPVSGGDFQRYYIYHGTDPNPTTLFDSTAAIDDTLKIYEGLSNYQIYYFRITAKDTNGNVSGYSDDVSVMPYDQTTPDAPVNLSATALDGQVELHWNPNSESDFLKYYIYGGTSIYPTTLIDSTNGNYYDTLKTITGLTNYQQYYFRVTAIDTNGYLSPYSEQIGVIPYDQTGVPTPANLVIEDSLHTNFTLRWNASVGADFRAYYIYGGTEPSPESLIDSTSNISDTMKVFTALDVARNYYFFVTAIDSSGNESGGSNEVVAAPNPPPAQFGEYITDPNTVLLMRFNETSGALTYDFSGQGNNGSATGATISSGRIGNARSFDGTNKYISIPDTNSLDLTDLFTVEAWIKVPTSTEYRTIIGKGRTSTSVGFLMGVQNDGKLNVVLDDNVNNTNVTSDVVLQANKWNHVAVNYDGDYVNLYINGKLSGTSASLVSLLNSAEPLLIGKELTSSSEGFFEGEIDEIRISNTYHTPDQFNFRITPENLSYYISGGPAIVLQWNNAFGLTPLSHYKVYRGTDSTNLALYDSSLYAIYEDFNPPLYSTYHYQVSSVDTTGFESARTEVLATFVPDTESPTQPQQFQPIVGDGVATLRWSTSPSTDVNKYFIYLNDDLFDSTNSYTDTTKVITSLNNGQSYRAYITALDSAGNGMFSGSNQFYFTPQLFDSAEYSADANTAMLLHLNETNPGRASDISGNNNYGYGFANVVDGKFGFARDILSDNVEISSSPSLEVANNSFTLEAWIHLNDPTQTVEIFRKDYDSRGYVVDMIPSDGKVRVTLTDEFSNQAQLFSTRSIVDEQWHHIAVMVNQDAAKLILFIDGVQDTTVSTSSLTGLIDGAGGLRLGPYVDGGAMVQKAPKYEAEAVRSVKSNMSAIFEPHALIDEVRISSNNRNPNEFYLQLPPKDIMVDVNGNSVNLAWNNGGGQSPLMQYYIFSGADSSAMTLIDSTFNPFYIDAGLSEFSTTYYRIAALDSTEFVSGKSYAVAAVVGDLTPPNQPQNLIATGGSSSVTVRWNQSDAADFEKYYIYRGLSVEALMKIDSTLAINDTMKVFFDVTNQTTYHFAVSVVDSFGNESIQSNFSNATPYSIYSIDATAFGGGMINPPGTASIAHGLNQGYSITPNPGNHLDSVLVNGIRVDSTESYTFLNVTSSQTIDAYFSQNPIYGFIVLSDSGGVITQKVAGQTFNIVTKAVDSLGNVLTEFTGNVWFSSTDSTMQVNGGNYSIPFTAGVHGPQNVLLLRAGINTITVIDSVSGKTGTSSPFTILPTALNSFTVKDTSSLDIITQMKEFPFAIKIVAYDLLGNIKTDYSGAVEVSVPGATISSGGGTTANFVDGILNFHQMVISTAGDFSIYVEDTLTGKLGASNTFTILPNTFDLTSTAYNGTINPSGISTVNFGDTITFTFSPNTGYHFDSLYVNGERVNDSTVQYTFANVTEIKTIDAYNSINQYSIYVNALGNGTITPGGLVVNYGDSATFSIVPDYRHHIDSITIAGINVGTDTSYTFYNVTSDHYLYAYFSPNPNMLPEFVSILSDTAIARFDTLYFQYTAFDPDSGVLKYSILSSPSGVEIDSVTGWLQYIPAANANGTYTIVVQVQDDSSAIIVDTTKVRVNIFGDVSGNGAVSALDATFILQDVVDIISLTPLQEKVADVSGSSTVSALDATYVLQYSVGIINDFPSGFGKQAKEQAILSAFSFRIDKGKNEDEYDLFVSVNKPSNVYGISMKLGFDSTVVKAVAMTKTTLTDSMSMAFNFPEEKANLALAGIRPLNNAGDIIKFTFILKDKNISKSAVLFTMDEFFLNETDHSKDIGGITLNVRGLAHLPTVYSLSQNFPNPFNPSTTINYELPEASSVKITIYNVVGQEIRTLISEHVEAGYYSTQWNGTDNNNRSVATGMYIYRIEAVGSNNKRFSQVKKMLLVK